MALERLLHGTHDPAAPGAIGRARGYEIGATLLLGGRRARLFRRLVAVSGARPGDRVLDIGCGTGYLTRRVARAVAPGGSVTGVDPSPTVLRYARDHTTEPGCTYTEGLAEALAEPDDAYDLVVSSFAFHHIPEAVRSRAVAETHRVLRPGGRLLIADFRPPRNGLARHLIGAATGPAMEHHQVHRIEHLVRDAGFHDLTTGDLRPFLHWVQATKPAAAGGPEARA
jgi:ubiquinone/menaquinone biosynthesis C-methylase UbiE